MTLKEKFKDKVLSIVVSGYEKPTIYTESKIIDEFDTFIEISYNENKNITINKNKIISISIL
ncbi:MAG: hypothetical protein ACRCZO_01575 [Cetobacterium sp.]